MIYIASPYSHKDPAVMQGRFEAVQHYTAQCMLEDELVFSPIVHCHELALSHDLPPTFAFWKRWCLGMVDAASVFRVLELPGWSDSVGLRTEMNHAHANEIPISFVKPDAATLSRLA